MSSLFSAFVQQRAKILPDAFSYIFHEFNNQSTDNKTYKGYDILAVDDTDVNIVKNENDLGTYIENGDNQGFNQLHINALYSICNKTYKDTIIQDKHKTNEVKRKLRNKTNVAFLYRVV